MSPNGPFVNFSDGLQQTGFSKSPKRPPIKILRHCEVFKTFFLSRLSREPIFLRPTFFYANFISFVFNVAPCISTRSEKFCEHRGLYCFWHYTTYRRRLSKTFPKKNRNIFLSFRFLRGFRLDKTVLIVFKGII